MDVEHPKYVFHKTKTRVAASNYDLAALLLDRTQAINSSLMYIEQNFSKLPSLILYHIYGIIYLIILE